MRPNVRGRPEGLAEDLRAGATQKALIRKYRCGPATLARWLDELDFHRGRGPHKRPVAQYEMLALPPPDGGPEEIRAGALLRVWPCIADAARGVYGTHGNIRLCCLGKFRQAYGYVWKYCEEDKTI